MRMPARRFLALSGVVFVAGLLLGVDAEAQPRRSSTVLTIHWGSEISQYDSDRRRHQGVAVLDPSTPVAYFTEYLESDRFPVEEAAAALSAYIRQKYAGRPIDVVIAVSDPALEFVGSIAPSSFRMPPSSWRRRRCWTPGFAPKGPERPV